jgi:Ca2+/H+ antiporter
MLILRTHTHVFARDAHDISDLREQFWSRSRSIVVLAAVMMFVAAMSEM